MNNWNETLPLNNGNNCVVQSLNPVIKGLIFEKANY